MIEGLNAIGKLYHIEEASCLALSLAERFLHSMFHGWWKTGMMNEVLFGSPLFLFLSSLSWSVISCFLLLAPLCLFFSEISLWWVWSEWWGWRYVPQFGFGWSNGVARALIAHSVTSFRLSHPGLLPPLLLLVILWIYPARCALDFRPQFERRTSLK